MNLFLIKTLSTMHLAPPQPDTGAACNWHRASFGVPAPRIFIGGWTRHRCGSNATTSPSRPRECHTAPLTDPGMNLSIHPARCRRRKAADYFDAPAQRTAYALKATARKPLGQ